MTAPPEKSPVDDPPIPAPAAATLGHSNRSLEDFLALLEDAAVRTLFDVRRHPSSRRHPQFNEGNLEEALADHGVDYRHREALGGFRSPRSDSPNTAWQSEGFQGYADHAATDGFRAAFEEIVDAFERLDAREPAGGVGIMCAEKDPERCHRRIISDRLVVRGIPVVHLIDRDTVREHTLTDFARVDGDRVTYPGLV